jgi:UDPglucose 6-dehydrogenase
MDIGIVGLGVVGKAVKAYHDSRGDEVWTYDIATDGAEALEALDNNADVVFICVGTPLGDDGKLDCSAVYDAVGNLTQKHTIIIKSTVMPGTTDAIQTKYPRHRVFFVPEFLDADTAVEDYATPKRSFVVGTPASKTRTAELLDAPIKASPVRLPMYCLDAREAELLKLATNTFYAFRVVFANMLFDLGMSQNGINAVFANPRIGDWGCDVHHRGYRGAAGACLSKDPIAFATLLNESTNEASTVLDAALAYNKHLVESTTKD